MQDKCICTVLLITYNYKEYLRESIESVLKQETKYKYKICIFDDASTDGSQEIILEYAKKYPEKIETYIAEKNMGAQDNIWRAFQSVDTKYFLVLEGDDYWCDSRKLEIQINAMEKHPECSFCGHDMFYIAHNDVTREYDDGTLICSQPILKVKNIFSFKDFEKIKDGGYIPYVSARMIRTEVLELDKIKHKESVLFDFSQFYYLLLKGKYYYIDLPMSVYRRTGQGVCSSKSALTFLNTFLQSAIDLNLQTNNVIADKIFDECMIQIDFQRKRHRNNGLIRNRYNRDGTVKELIEVKEHSESLLIQEDEFEEDSYYFLCNGGLGFTMILASLKKRLEERFKAKIFFMVQEKQEFILKLYGIEDYLTVDLEGLDLEKLSERYPNPTKGKIYVAHPFAHQEAQQYYLSILHLYSTERYLPWLLEFFGLDKEIEIEYPLTSPELSEESHKKIKEMGDLSKAVLCLPNSHSIPGVSQLFWIKKVKLLKKEGYTVYSASEDLRYTIRGTKYIKLYPDEIMYLGMKCHSVYSLRNGFCDLLKSRGKNLHVIYPNHATQFIYSLNKEGREIEVEEEIVLEPEMLLNTQFNPGRRELPLLFGLIRIPDRVYAFYSRHRRFFRNKKLIKMFVKWK